MKQKKAGLLKTLGLAGAVALGAVGCTSVGENEVAVKKNLAGEVTYHEGPIYEHIGWGTSTVEWDGRRVLELPLERSSEESKYYETKNGTYVDLKLFILYEIGKDSAQRTEWYVTKSEPLEQFAKAAEGVARSVVKNYVDDQILNMDAAMKAGKLPFFLEIHKQIYESDIAETYGLNDSAFAVLPGNTSLLEQAVLKDLERQVKVYTREAESKAMEFELLATQRRAQADSAYGVFLKTIPPSAKDYLQTLDITKAVRGVGSEQEQDVDFKLIIN